ncbi:ENTH/VHS family protein [Actinidia rufa]|uniref:ENTH/VHS family protein n=1 Tax=Actinidia rufa TaxID=165716 RepID=A0A7J0DFW1_9ERIC|nr:ENTH/VHS family protein [Actinidia rufa]
MNKAKHVVETWDKQFHYSPREQRLVFLYLANDILQNSRRKGSEFVGEFWKVLPNALGDVIENGDGFSRNAALRLVRRPITIAELVAHDLSKGCLSKNPLDRGKTSPWNLAKLSPLSSPRAKVRFPPRPWARYAQYTLQLSSEPFYLLSSPWSDLHAGGVLSGLAPAVYFCSSVQVALQGSEAQYQGDRAILTVGCSPQFFTTTKTRHSAGNALDQIASSYQVLYGGLLDEDAILSKCRNAISCIEKVDKEIGDDHNPAILKFAKTEFLCPERFNGSGIMEELPGKKAILRDCIEHLPTVESSRENLVSHLREALWEQEFKLDKSAINFSSASVPRSRHFRFLKKKAILQPFSCPLCNQISQPFFEGMDFILPLPLPLLPRSTAIHLLHFPLSYVIHHLNPTSPPPTPIFETLVKGVSKAKGVCWQLIKTLRVARGKIPRAECHREARGYSRVVRERLLEKAEDLQFVIDLAGLSRDRCGMSREEAKSYQIATDFAGFLHERDQQTCNDEICIF